MALSADKTFGVIVYNIANAECEVVSVCNCHVMKVCKESGNKAPYILNFITCWRWIISFARCFTTGERVPFYVLNGRLDRPEIIINMVMKRKLPTFARN
jgi:hypothetical protein